MNNNYFYSDFYNQDYMMPAIENNLNSNNIFTSVKDGFLKGNMQAGSFIPYKNYTYIAPSITDERKRMLYEIQENSFAAHEANLYLDTHPNDSDMIRLFKEYNKKVDELTLNYERKYGPICLSDNEGIKNTSWNWIDKPWPWDK